MMNFWGNVGDFFSAVLLFAIIYYVWRCISDGTLMPFMTRKERKEMKERGSATATHRQIIMRQCFPDYQSQSYYQEAVRDVAKTLAANLNEFKKYANDTYRNLNGSSSKNIKQTLLICSFDGSLSGFSWHHLHEYKGTNGAGMPIFSECDRQPKTINGYPSNAVKPDYPNSDLYRVGLNYILMEEVCRYINASDLKKNAYPIFFNLRVAENVKQTYPGYNLSEPYGIEVSFNVTVDSRWGNYM